MPAFGVKENKLAILRTFLGKAHGEVLSNEEVNKIGRMETRIFSEDYISPEERFANLLRARCEGPGAGLGPKQKIHVNQQVHDILRTSA